MGRYIAMQLALVSLLVTQVAIADEYSDAIARFEKATESQGFFENAYGFAIFPTVRKGGFFIGGAYGEGRVYLKNKVTAGVSLA